MLSPRSMFSRRVLPIDSNARSTKPKQQPVDGKDASAAVFSCSTQSCSTDEKFNRNDDLSDTTSTLTEDMRLRIFLKETCNANVLEETMLECGPMLSLLRRKFKVRRDRNSFYPSTSERSILLPAIDRNLHILSFDNSPDCCNVV